MIKWLGLAVAGVLLASALQSWFTELLYSSGLPRPSSENTDAAMNWLANVIGDNTFRWVAGCVFGFTAGVWLDHLARRLGWGGLTKYEKAKSLSFDMYELEKDLRWASENSQPMRDHQKAEVEALYITLKKEGIMTPSPDVRVKGGPSFFSTKYHHNYLVAVGPILAKGHMREAKRKAKEVSADIETTAGRLTQMLE